MPKAGPYLVYIQWTQTPEYADNPFVLKCAASQLSARFPSTGGWRMWQRRSFGQLDLPSGRQRIELHPNGPVNGELSDLREIHLVPVAGGKYTARG